MPLGDGYDLSTGFSPADMQTAQTGKRLYMSLLESVDVIWIKAAGTAGDDPTLTLQAHTAASGGTSANHAVIDTYWLKNETTLDGDETWTKKTQTAAATIADPGGATTSAEEEMIVVFTVRADQLPSGKPYISCNVADTGTNAQLGTILYHINGYDRKAPEDLRVPLR